MKLLFKYFVGIALIISVVSCRNENIIPQKDMVKILTKVYLTDGTLRNIDRKIYMNKDSIQYYEPILESYGYTTANFDSSIKYYSYNTEIFDEILDRVIIELTKLEEQYTDNAHVAKVDNSILDSTLNKWPLKTYWNMSSDSKTNPHLGFDIPINKRGRYELTFDALIFPYDSVIGPYFKAYMHYGTAESVMGDLVGLQTHYYKKDSLQQSFSFSFEASDSLITLLSGYLYLYNQDSTKEDCIKNTIFSNIYVKYIPDASPKKGGKIDKLKLKRPFKDDKKPAKADKMQPIKAQNVE